MSDIDLRELSGDQIVIHFGGALTSVDAYTFGNSLIAFADTIRAVNAVVNPEQNIEIRLEAIGPGSFRAVVKRLWKGLGGFFSRGAEAIFWTLIASIIYDHLIRNDPNIIINVGEDEVTIVKDGDKIIIPRAVYNQLPQIRANPEVQKNLSRTFQVIEEDPAIENFGLTPHLDDAKPLVQVSRSEFSSLAELPALIEATTSERRRERRERVRLVILKAWLIRGNRKWSFEWNGIPISAIIKDGTFFDKLSSHEILIGQGDALDAELIYEQDYEDSLGVYVNDTQTFQIVKVFGTIPRARQPHLPESS